MDTGLRVGKLGNSSVRYEVGMFVTGSDEISAAGYFTDVFVDRATEKPIKIPDGIRSVLSQLIVE